MRKFSVLTSVLLGTAISAVAQTCATPPAQRTFSNRDEFEASFYYNIGNHFFDLNAQRQISISEIRTWTYDQGAGNPIVPSQVGNLATIEVYTCPNTRTGNEAINPTAPGSPWTLLGTGQLTVVATPGESPIVFNPPLVLAAGQYGVAIKYNAPTAGLNPGPLHCLGKSPNPNLPVSDQFLTFSNDGIQAVSWTGVSQDSPNLRIIYTPEATSAHWLSVGDGCYFRPYAWYESFPASATPPDVANTGLQWIYTGTNYVVVSGSNAIVTPTTPSLTLNPPAQTSSGNWDDALAAPITLPFTLNYPGGSTNDITISSNGCIYLAAVSSNTYDVCGAAYGSIAPFRDQAARLCGYFHDLDLSTAGSLHYEVGPGNAFVRVTWLAVPEWPVPTALNTIQVTIDSVGNVTCAYGALANTGVANGNNALLGFTPGNGSRLAPPIDLSASLPYTTGDGSLPAILSLDTRPVIGTTVNITTTNIAPTTPLQVLGVGAALTPVPLPLAFLGMPDCFLNINALVFLTTLGPPPMVQPLGIPNNPTLLNATVTAQAFPLAIGANPFGLISSNGVCMRVGF